MDYKTLSIFDDQKLLEGMQTYYQNAQDLLDTGRDLVDQDKYGLATALTVLSIEELIKAYATFQVYIGETNPNNINPAFEAKNLHKTRLKLASCYNYIFDHINQGVIKDVITGRLESLGSYGKDEFDNTDILMKYVDDLIEKINLSVITETIEIPDNFEVEIKETMNDHSNWYSHAQKVKEKGLYADYIDNKWHLPQNMTKEDYEKAYTCAIKTFDKIGNPIKQMIEGDDLKREIIRRIIKKIISTGDNKGPINE